MAASVFPFGNLISFGSHTFTAHRSAIVTPTEEVTPSYAPVIGRLYPIDRVGNAVQALGASGTGGVVHVWEYHIIAQDYAPAAGQELKACQTEYNALRTFLVDTNGDGTTKAVDTLSVYDGDTTTIRTASARLVKLEVKDWLWDYLHVELSWALRAEFV
jgi:hypothetical protein